MSFCGQRASHLAPHHAPRRLSLAACIIAVIPLNSENVSSPQTPTDIGDLILNILSIFKNFSGRPRSFIRSGGHGSRASNDR
jgi:hypothetical protein